MPPRLSRRSRCTRRGLMAHWVSTRRLRPCELGRTACSTWRPTPCTPPSCTTKVAHMAVPGNVPADLAATELFAVDAYTTEFGARVTEVDEAGARIRLDRTAFYPGGGGQPYDLGTLETPVGDLAVTAVRREAGAIWHTVDGDLPDPGAEVRGVLDWTRRHQLMR